MSLFVLPTTPADLIALEEGIQFFTNTDDATSEVILINASGWRDTVDSYALKLIAANISLSVVAMGVDSLMFGATDTVAELAHISMQFLPGQVTNAIANGLNPTVYAAEALGLVFAGGNGTSEAFATDFGSLDLSQFAHAVMTITGIDANAI